MNNVIAVIFLAFGVVFLGMGLILAATGQAYAGQVIVGIFLLVIALPLWEGNKK